MPPLDEGDLLYMPSALPGLSAGKAAELLQQTDRSSMRVPGSRARVRQGWARRDRDRSGAAGNVRDDDPVQAALRVARGHDADKLDRRARCGTVRVPGLANIWVPPIRNRIDMLATGIKSPVGIKVAGPDLAVIDRIGAADRSERSRRTGRDLGAGRTR